MYDYPERIKEFISVNFTSCSEKEAELKVTTVEFLEILNNCFPKNCISEFDLVEILLDLGFKEQLYVTIDENEKKRATIGWCMLTGLDLE